MSKQASRQPKTGHRRLGALQQGTQFTGTAVAIAKAIADRCPTPRPPCATRRLLQRLRDHRALRRDRHQKPICGPMDRTTDPRPDHSTTLPTAVLDRLIAAPASAEAKQARRKCGRWLATRVVSQGLTNRTLAEQIGADEQALLLLEAGLAHEGTLTDASRDQLAHLLADDTCDPASVAAVLATALGQVEAPTQTTMSRVLDDLHVPDQTFTLDGLFVPAGLLDPAAALTLDDLFVSTSPLEPAVGDPGGCSVPPGPIGSSKHAGGGPPGPTGFTLDGGETSTDQFDLAVITGLDESVGAEMTSYTAMESEDAWSIRFATWLFQRLFRADVAAHSQPTTQPLAGTFLECCRHIQAHQGWRGLFPIWCTILWGLIAISLRTRWGHVKHKARVIWAMLVAVGRALRAFGHPLVQVVRYAARQTGRGLRLAGRGLRLASHPKALLFTFVGVLCFMMLPVVSSITQAPNAGPAPAPAVSATPWTQQMLQAAPVHAAERAPTSMLTLPTPTTPPPPTSIPHPSGMLLASRSRQVPWPSPSILPTPSPTATPTATPMGTESPTAGHVVGPSIEPPTTTPIPTRVSVAPSAEPSAPAKSTPTATPRPSATACPTILPRQSAGSAGCLKPTPSPRATACPTTLPRHAAIQPCPVATLTPTATLTRTPTSTALPTRTAQPTVPPTHVPIPTDAPTNTARPTEVPTATPTEAPPITPTNVPTATPAPTSTPDCTGALACSPAPTTTPTSLPAATSMPAGPSVCQPRQRPIDLILAVDRSSSMRGQNLEDARRAAKMIVNAVDPSADQVGLVTFTDRARLDQPLTYDQADVIAAIDQITSGTGTSIAAGIQEASFELTGLRHNSTATPVLILLSDGRADAPAATAAADTAKISIRIITVGLGPDVNETLLRRISSFPGDYIRLPSAAATAADDDLLARMLSCLEHIERAP